MNSTALVFMLVVWTIVLIMLAYFYSKMLRSKKGFGSDGEDSDDRETP